MNGWTGHILRVNLTTKTFKKEPFSEEFARKWVGGRGFAVKILYDELKPGDRPPRPREQVHRGPGAHRRHPGPEHRQSGRRRQVAPCTGGYGDGNLGTRVTEQLRKAGYDALIVEGKADRPTMLYHRGRQGRVPAGR